MSVNQGSSISTFPVCCMPFISVFLISLVLMVNRHGESRYLALFVIIWGKS